MSTYIKQDKDNNNVVLIIKPDNIINSWINCTLYKVQIFNLLLFKINYHKELYQYAKPIEKTYDWTCIDMEQWVDKCIIDYNDVLTNREKKKKALEFINKGCN